LRDNPNNSCEPELIRILFVTPLDEKHGHNTSGQFGQKKLELLPESSKLNGKIFFELFLSDLDEKMISLGNKRERNQKQTRECDKPLTYSICHNEKDRPEQAKKSFLLVS